jgi:hypothetical protein
MYLSRKHIRIKNTNTFVDRQIVLVHPSKIPRSAQANLLNHQLKSRRAQTTAVEFALPVLPLLVLRFRQVTRLLVELLQVLVLPHLVHIARVLLMAQLNLQVLGRAIGRFESGVAFRAWKWLVYASTLGSVRNVFGIGVRCRWGELE